MMALHGLKLLKIAECVLIAGLDESYVISAGNVYWMLECTSEICVHIGEWGRLFDY